MNLVIAAFPYRVSFGFQVSERAISKDQVPDLCLFQGEAFLSGGGVAIAAIALKRKIVTFKKFLPGNVDRCGVLFIVLIELIQIAHLRVRYIGVFIHHFGSLPLLMRNKGREGRLDKKTVYSCTQLCLIINVLSEVYISHLSDLNFECTWRSLIKRNWTRSKIS